MRKIIKKLTVLALMVFVVLVVTVGVTPPPAYAAAIMVTTVDDNEDDNDDFCTLREAINNANTGGDTTSGDCAAGTVGLDTIVFDIDGAGVHTISPASALPTITDPVIIDGYSQPGSSFNTNSITLGSNAVLTIELDGSGAGSVFGLDISAGGSTVKGLVINRGFVSGIRLLTLGGNTIEGNFIGTEVTGTVDLGNQIGVLINGAPSNTIGGTTAAARNVISGNGNGVIISGATATMNVVEGNFIGTDVTGTVDLRNTQDGVRISGAPSNTVGGTTVAARNVISNNGRNGVLIATAAATGNMVKGNFIGTDTTGTVALGNRNGVSIDDAPGNTIGGTTAAERNVISDSTNGVDIRGANAMMNVVEGNFIGTDATGTVALGNGIGVVITNAATSNTIGGDTGTTPEGACTGACNVISGSGGFFGVFIFGGATMNVVKGNFIGTDVLGTGALGNKQGVRITGASGNTIGGTTDAERNVISGNNENGVSISGGATMNVVKGNFIGTDTTGTADLGNTLAGVKIDGAPSNTIGGTTAAERNVISGNNQNGVVISGADAMGNLVHANFIGTNAAGTSMLPNLGAGVLISGGASGNSIGTTTPGEGNTIAFNTLNGVRVTGATINNPVRGNSIHDNGGLGIDNLSGGNTELAVPIFTGFITGTACANCEVDLYSDAANEGKNFEGSTTADGSGKWSLVVTPTDPNLTATATDASNNTSEFSTAFTPSACQMDWPVDTVNTIAKGKSPANNLKVSHAITGHFVGGAAAFEPKGHRIKICEGSAVSIVVADTTGTPTVTALTAGLSCNSAGCSTIGNLTATEKYKAVSSDGKDTDRVTLLPVP